MLSECCYQIPTQRITKQRVQHDGTETLTVPLLTNRTEVEPEVFVIHNPDGTYQLKLELLFSIEANKLINVNVSEIFIISGGTVQHSSQKTHFVHNQAAVVDSINYGTDPTIAFEQSATDPYQLNLLISTPATYSISDIHIKTTFNE